MKRLFVTNLILLVGLNLLVKPFYLLVMEAHVQNQVGETAFGNYFALINLSIIFNILLDLGITNWNNREVAREGKGLLGTLKSLLRVKWWLFPLYVSILSIAALSLGYDASQWKILAWLMVNQLLVSMTLFLRSYLSGLHLFKADSFISVLDRILLIVMLLIMFSWGNSFEIMWFVWAQTIAYAITALVTLFIVLQKRELSVQPIPLQWAPVLKQSAPFAILFAVSMLIYRVDSVMLERMHEDGAYESGVYAMAFRLFEAFNMVAYLFAALLLPIFSRLIAQNQSVGPIVKTGFRLMLTAVVIFALLGWFNSAEIMQIIYDDPDQNAILSLHFLVIGCSAFSMQYIFGTLLTANGNMRQLIAIMCIGAILNILMNLILIPQLGAVGCAIANATSHSLVLFLQIWYSFKVFKFRFDRQLAWKCLVFIVMSIFLAWAGSSFFWLETIFELRFTITLGVSAILLGLAALLSGIIDFKQLPDLLRMKDSEGRNNQNKFR